MILDIEQTELRAVVRRLLEGDEAKTPERAHQRLADLDAVALLVDAERGGAGGGLVDLVVVCAEAGRVLVPGLLVSTAATTATLLGSIAGDAIDDELARLARGRRYAVLGLTGDELVLEREGGAPRLNGRARFVEDAHVADSLVVVVRSANDIGVFVLDADTPGVYVEPLGGIGPTEPCHVELRGVDIRVDRAYETSDGDRVLAEVNAATAVGRSAVALGGAERVMELVLGYTADRQQFGRSIGSNQAVQFACVDMVRDVEAMRCSVFRAAVAFDEREDDRWMLASAAAAWTAEAYARVVAGAHALFGAIGFTQEFGLHRYTKAAEAHRLAAPGLRAHRQHVLRAVARETDAQHREDD